jgi:hypothetical protein
MPVLGLLDRKRYSRMGPERKREVIELVTSPGLRLLLRRRAHRSVISYGPQNRDVQLAGYWGDRPSDRVAPGIATLKNWIGFVW